MGGNHFKIKSILYRKNPKDHKLTAQKPVEKKAEPRKETNAAGVLPPIQSKEVLLLDHDYGRAFAKRKVESNWDRYAELSDDEDNPQEMAADFEKILLAPKSIGEHFVFSSERAWENSVNSVAETNADFQPNDLFKLNLGNLKNGVGRLPFYLRNNLNLDLFSDDEITNMNFGANYSGNNNKKQKAQTIGVSGLKSMAEKRNDRESVQRSDVQMDSIDTPTMQSSVKLPESTIKLAESTLQLPSQSQAAKTIGKPETSTKTTNIQDWLDDILNE